MRREADPRDTKLNGHPERFPGGLPQPPACPTDASKLAQAIEAGRGDPKAFTSLLSPRTLERLRALSVKIADPKR